MHLNNRISNFMSKILYLLLVSVLLTACGGGGDGDDDQPEILQDPLDPVPPSNGDDPPPEADDPPPSPPPPPPGGGGPSNPPPPPVTGSGGLQFTDVTMSVIDRAPAVPTHFDINFLDVNSDGFWDIYVGSHGADYSALYTQNADGSNTFVYQDPVSANYYQTQRVGGEWLRITGNYMFLDLNGDGKTDFTGWDADLGATGYYENITPAGRFNPLFAEKSVGFPNDNDFGILADINGDKNIDAIEIKSYSDTNQDMHRRIIDFQSKNILYPEVTNAEEIGLDRTYYVGDLNGDSWPDIFASSAGGYWQNNNGQLNWRETWDAKFPGKVTIADFDNDTDLDIILSQITRDGPPSVHVGRNDGNGNFEILSGNRGLTLNGTLHDIYGDRIFADINNDGLMDFITSGEDYGKTVRIYLNVGSFNFQLLDIDFGGYDGGFPHVAVVDYDDDGDLDILKTHDPHSSTHQSLAIWRNDSDLQGNHWLKLRIRGFDNNTEGMHTQIIAYEPGTSNVITSYYTVLSQLQNALYPHIGLGSNTIVDLEVRFPHSGPVYRYNDVNADQTLLVYQDGTLAMNWQRGDWPLDSADIDPNLETTGPD